ncbi:hypothetical protein VSR01_15325 [Actinacidiphila sp. DG2A-62]|uniref:hypothetical protein n=1 Tax=Actinacidiphila sp. DG2A-62 TaxID=3108821 RepID=UPI002DBC92DE|nr:hypothetical protein [Actinacidiphila sp. DG2A-62]MEC3994820.1 hypothetical protein [Actinacidiphila sp. DG2A-62]
MNAALAAATNDTETLVRVRGGLRLDQTGAVTLPAPLLDDLSAVLDSDRPLTSEQIQELTRRLKGLLRVLLRIAPPGNALDAPARRLVTERAPATGVAALGHLRRSAVCVLDIAEYVTAAPPRDSPDSG